jgi:hypothetical protein
MKTAHAIALKGQDLLVAMKLATTPWDDSLEALGEAVGLSTSEARQALLRADAAGLASAKRRRAHRPALLEFLTHGARYAFPAVLGRRGRGVLTGAAAPPLSEHLVVGEDGPLVWPYPEGTARGETLAAIYPSAPKAALADPDLYALLVLLDGVRLGSARVRGIAQALLQERLR